MSKAIKVLTLWQPYATLFVHGLKRYETRPSKTSFKGMYLIQAAKQMNKLCKELCQDPVFAEALRSLGYYKIQDLPLGQIIGAYDHELCLPITSSLISKPGHFHTSNLTPEEEYFGDYADGRYVWMGSNHRRLDNPFDYTNGQGYYQNYKGDLSLIEQIMPRTPTSLSFKFE